MDDRDDVDRGLDRLEQRFLKRAMIAKAEREDYERERRREQRREDLARRIAKHIPTQTRVVYSGNRSNDGLLGLAAGIGIGALLS